MDASKPDTGQVDFTWDALCLKGDPAPPPIQPPPPEGMAVLALNQQVVSTIRVPKTMRDRYEELLQDPDYVSGRESIALLKAFYEEALERAYSGDSISSRFTICEMLIELEQKAQFEWGPTEVAEALKRILKYAKDDRRKEECKTDALNYQEAQRKWCETEVKRMVAANQVLTIMEAQGLVMELVDIIEEYVEDEVKKRHAGRRIWKLLNHKGNRSGPPKEER